MDYQKLSDAELIQLALESIAEGLPLHSTVKDRLEELGVLSLIEGE